METYAKVVVRSNTIHTDNLFTYKVPVFLIDDIKVGHRILVPFGKGNKPTEAFVFEITDFLEEDFKTKDMYLKGYNHFDGYHRIYQIPELIDLINKLL